ncbi:MAG: hypothetical protein HW421_697 [Ignavibacteria bacterium]|nr:hypothetical protein [Ignavibacteria bacterium]
MNSPDFLSKEELSSLLGRTVNPFDFHKILSAYEFAENAFHDDVFHNTNPLWFHVTRVTRILIEELNIQDADLLCCSLLFKISQSKEGFSREIIELNFGSYSALMLDYLSNESFSPKEFFANALSLEQFNALPVNDILIIHLADCLDNLRNFSSDLANVKHDVFRKTASLIKLPVHIKNENINRLLDEIKFERNKIFG